MIFKAPFQDMTTICEEEVNKLKRLQSSGGARGGAGGGAEGRVGINTAVSSDVGAIFKGKTVGACMCSSTLAHRALCTLTLFTFRFYSDFYLSCL